MKNRHAIYFRILIIIVSIFGIQKLISQTVIAKASGYSLIFTNQVSSGIEVKLPKGFSTQLVYTYYSHCNYDCTDEIKIIPELRYYLQFIELDKIYLHTFYEYIYTATDLEEGEYQEQESHVIGLGLGYQFHFKNGIFLDIGLAPTLTNYPFINFTNPKIGLRFSLFVGFNLFQKK